MCSTKALARRPLTLSRPRPLAKNWVPLLKRSRGGPGGWMILDEPEIHLGEHILVPDLGGWRRERMPETPHAAYLELSPDWVCEVSSPSTRRLDRGPKREVYGTFEVPWLWYVEPLDQLIEVLRLDGETYRIAQTISGAEPTRDPPFRRDRAGRRRSLAALSGLIFCAWGSCPSSCQCPFCLCLLWGQACRFWKSEFCP